MADSEHSELLGTFEEQVLLAVLHAPSPAYGMTVRREIEQRTSRSVSIGAVYSTINRLEAKGLLESHRAEPDETRDGRARRFLRVRSEGLEALASTRRIRGRMWKGVDLAILPEAKGR